MDSLRTLMILVISHFWITYANLNLVLKPYIVTHLRRAQNFPKTYISYPLISTGSFAYLPNEQPLPKWGIFIRSPFIGSTSSQTQKKLSKQFIKKLTLCNLNIIFASLVTLRVKCPVCLSGPYFYPFGLNTKIYRVNVRIQPKYWKIRT